MGDDDHGAPLGQCGQSRLRLALGPGVDAGGGLVHDEHGRVGEGRPGQAHQLALAGRQVRAPLAHVGVLALGQAGHPVRQAQAGNGLPGLVMGGARAAQGHVFQHRSPEQEALLGQHHDPLPDVGQQRLAQVDPAEADRARQRVVQAPGQFGQGRLAPTGRADQGQPLARLDPQVDPLQHQALVQLSGVVVVGVDAVGEVDATAVRAASVPAGQRGVQGRPWPGPRRAGGKTVARAAPDDWSRSNRADRLVMALNRLAR